MLGQAIFGILDAYLDRHHGVGKPSEYQATYYTENRRDLQDQQIQDMVENFGNAIGANTDLTPLQMARQVTVNVTVGGMAFTAGLAAFNPIAALGMGAATAVAAISAGYVNKCVEDLDSPEERALVVKRVAQLPLSKIAEEFSVDKVVKYHLLQGKLSLEDHPLEVENLYTKFVELSSHIQLAKDHAKESKEKVEKKFNENGLHLANKMKESSTEDNVINPDMCPTSKRRWVSYCMAAKESEVQKRLTEWVDWKEDADKAIDDALSQDLYVLDREFANINVQLDEALSLDESWSIV